VLAFEADDYTFEVLRKNVQANQRHNIRTFLAAVFDSTGTRVVFPKAEFLRFPWYSAQSVDLSARTGKTVETLSVDHLEIRAPISLMHIETNEAQLNVLRGAVQTIAAQRMPIVMDFDADPAGHNGPVGPDLEEFLKSVSYRSSGKLDARHLLLLPVEFNQAESESAGMQGQGGMSPSLQEAARPQVLITEAPFLQSLCKLLKSRAEVEECTQFLKRNGFVSHNLVCKDWDLAHIVPSVGDGDFLDRRPRASSLSFPYRRSTRGEETRCNRNLPLLSVRECDGAGRKGRHCQRAKGRRTGRVH
jgi:FkbM family methyltransferase